MVALSWVAASPAASKPHQLYPAVACPAFQGVIGFFRTRGAKARRCEPVGGYMVAFRQRLLHRGSPAVREFHVVGLAADIIRVSFHAELPRRVLGQRGGDFLQHWLRFRTDDV